MKSIFQKTGLVLCLIILLGFVIGTGGVTPPDDALVLVSMDKTKFYPPTNIPNDLRFLIEASYIEAKEMGAKPYKSSGFNVEGPPLIIDVLVSNGIISSWPIYWSGTNEKVQLYKP